AGRRNPDPRACISTRNRRPARAPSAVPLMSTHAILEVAALSKAFGGVQAVRDVSFAVRAGQMIALIGPNGAGKTTCFNLTNGQLAPDAGVVRLRGERI